VYWADATHPMGSLYQMRKFRNVSAENNAVTRVAGQLTLLTDVYIHHELRQPPGLLDDYSVNSVSLLFSMAEKFNSYSTAPLIRAMLDSAALYRTFTYV